MTTDVTSTPMSLNSTRYGVKLSKQEIAASVHAAMHSQRKALVEVFAKKLQGLKTGSILMIRARNERGRSV